MSNKNQNQSQKSQSPQSPPSATGSQAPEKNIEDSYLGRFIGVQSTGKDKYRVMILDTIGSSVVRVEDLTKSPLGLHDYQAFAQIVYSLSTHMRAALPRLSRLNPNFYTKESVAIAYKSLKEVVGTLDSHGLSRKAMDLSLSIVDKFLEEHGIDVEELAKSSTEKTEKEAA